MAVFEEVWGRFIAPDGSPLSGSVIFTPAFPFARDTQTVTLPAPVTVQLDSEGRVTASLQVPDESTQPTTWTWQACPRLRHAGGAVGLEPFSFELVAGAPVNLADVLPVPNSTGEYVTRGETGADGVGLAAITTEGGELVFTLTDGTESRIPVPQGVPGTGVAGISLEGDELVFAMTDGSESRIPAPVGTDGQDGDDGQDGVGISTITLEDGELVIALTDGAVTRLPAPKGDPGKDGTSPPPPTLRVEQVQTLPPGATATAHIGGEAPDYTLTLAVPQGPQGEAGKDAVIQDTGWRDIKEEIAPTSHFPPEAIFTIKRRDDIVFFQVAIPESASSSVQGTSWGYFRGRIPDGFRPTWGGSVVLHGRDATNGHIGIQPNGGILWTGQTLDKAYRTHACGVWPTADAWPATLPGTPA
ncbi:hypothetical protein [Rothia nasimurium]|uniref:hypothetical protein n=1 Tax=Rothia nasimurium TaxID=85336 RepID=UPI001F2A9533|nr:hypothetical protein [Rothia nasimurium]